MINSLQSISLSSLLIILVLTLDVTSGIRCYECSTSWNEDCSASPPPSRYLKPCAVPLCSKLYAEENGIIRVERYCGGSDFTTGCRDMTFPDRTPGARYFRAISCRCNDQDACNFASSNFSSGVFMTISLLLFSLFAIA